MEVDPPKEDAASADAPAPEGNDKEPPKSEDAEMKEDEASGAASPKAAEEPKKEMKTEKRKKVVSKTIDLPVTSIVVGAMSRDKLDNAVEQEKVLVNQDTYESDRYVASNNHWSH